MIDNAKDISIKATGGLNTLDGPLAIGDNESPNCKNVLANLAGSLERRNGFSTVGTAATGTTGNGVFDYWKDSSTNFLMSYMDNYLYKMDNTGTFDGTLDAVTFGTAMSDDIMEFDHFNESGTNYLIMATHSRDKLQKWNGTGATTDVSADADLPASKFIKSWKGYLFCANVSGNESRVYYNAVSGAISGATDWDATDFQDIRTNDGDFITGLAILKGRLYTFKRHSIHRWTYFGGTPLFGIKTSVSGIGAISGKTIMNISHPKHGEVLVFLAADRRFYAFDGSQIIPLSSKIDNDNGISEFNLGKLQEQYLAGACASDYKKKHIYVCWVPLTSYNNWCVALDYYTDAWWPFTGMEARACSIATDNEGTNAYFIEDDGKIAKFDDSDDDAGANISAIYDFKKLNYGKQSALKKQRYVDIQAKAIGDYSINFQRRSDWDASWGTAISLSMLGGGFILGTGILGTDVLGGDDGVTRTIDLPYNNHIEQFRISTNGTDPSWSVYSIDIVAKGVGYGRSG